MFVAHDRKNTRMEQDPVPVRATREKKKTLSGPPRIYTYIYKGCALASRRPGNSILQSTLERKVLPPKVNAVR
jgi:hypothetical protein